MKLKQRFASLVEKINSIFKCKCRCAFMCDDASKFYFDDGLYLNYGIIKTLTCYYCGKVETQTIGNLIDANTNQIVASSMKEIGEKNQHVIWFEKDYKS